ncbi:uncharacterized protein LOC134791243 [Cydia splendana]|uniref:uncharacterized protein LOC134791243 n=1 Tax=Cydia splendana TaxID=1100963 RepID=UPI0028F4C4F9
MSFHFKVFSILTNTVVAVIVVCVIAHASASTDPSTPEEEEEKMDTVEEYVSRMMSKFPVKKEPVEPYVSGIPYSPNVVYERYWTDVPDRTWEEKCARCPELFKSYGTVCAMDSTGELLVNITMCKLLQMNCLGGTARGKSRGKWADFKDDYFVVQEGWARFAVRHEQNLVVHLSSTPDLRAPYYTMLIDDYYWRGYSSIYKDNHYQPWFWTPYYAYASLLGKEKWAEYVIHWNSTTGWLLITRSSYDTYINNFHFNINDANNFPIKYIAIGGSAGYDGEWIIKDLPSGFVVNQLSPCKDLRLGMVRSLVTSPTDVPGIMARLTPVNERYISMVDYAGVQQGNGTHFGNVSFLTREEY